MQTRDQNDHHLPTPIPPYFYPTTEKIKQTGILREPNFSSTRYSLYFHELLDQLSSLIVSKEDDFFFLLYNAVYNSNCDLYPRSKKFIEIVNFYILTALITNFNDKTRCINPVNYTATCLPRREFFILKQNMVLSPRQ